MIDSVEIIVNSGRGGDGVSLFRREKHVPGGGPSGGDGGKGGAVIFKTDSGLNTLHGFRKNQVFRASDGQAGKRNRQEGANGEDLVIRVPPGTRISEISHTGTVRQIIDLTKNGETWVYLKGGVRGRGNARFVRADNQEPRLCESGESGEQKKLRLDMVLLADVAIIGMPNAGKSSLLRAISSAKPKVADYPFTTLDPVLGVVSRGYGSLVVVDVPGLIKDAHEGKGLGDQFLKHIKRTQMLVHVVDGTEPDLLGRVKTINQELASYDPQLMKRPQVIVINKIDLIQSQADLEDIRSVLDDVPPSVADVLCISAVAQQGLNDLITTLFRVFGQVRKDYQSDKEPASEQIAVFRPLGLRTPPSVIREKQAFRVVKSKAVRLAMGSDLDDPVVRLQYHRELLRMGIINKLQEMGVGPGATILVGDRELQWSG